VPAGKRAHEQAGIERRAQKALQMEGHKSVNDGLSGFAPLNGRAVACLAGCKAGLRGADWSHCLRHPDGWASLHR